jgi:hypothetical protein
MTESIKERLEIFADKFFDVSDLEGLMEQGFDFNPYPEAIKNIVTIFKIGGQVDVERFTEYLREGCFPFNEHPEVVADICPYLHRENFHKILHNVSAGVNGFDFSEPNTAPRKYLETYLYGKGLDFVLQVADNSKKGQGYEVKQLDTSSGKNEFECFNLSA